MANEKKKKVTEEVEVVNTNETEICENVSEKKASKVKEWFSKHKVGLIRAAKAAALIGGGIVAGVLISSNKKKSDDEEMLALGCGDWDDDFDDDLSEEDSVEDAPEEGNNEG